MPNSNPVQESDTGNSEIDQAETDRLLASMDADFLPAYKTGPHGPILVNDQSDEAIEAPANDQPDYQTTEPEEAEVSRPPVQEEVASCEENTPADQIDVEQPSLTMAELDMLLAGYSKGKGAENQAPERGPVSADDQTSEPDVVGPQSTLAQEPVAATPEPAPARVFSELDLAPGCFGSALSFNAEDTICRACSFGAKCQPAHEQAKERMRDKFGVAVPSPKQTLQEIEAPSPDQAQEKIEVLSNADLRRLAKNASYHRRKPPLKNKKPSLMEPAAATTHKKSRKAGNSRDYRKRQREQKLADKAKEAAALTGGPVIIEGMFS